MTLRTVFPHASRRHSRICQTLQHLDKILSPDVVQLKILACRYVSNTCRRELFGEVGNRVELIGFDLSKRNFDSNHVSIARPANPVNPVFQSKAFEVVRIGTFIWQRAARSLLQTAQSPNPQQRSFFSSKTKSARGTFPAAHWRRLMVSLDTTESPRMYNTDNP